MVRDLIAVVGQSWHGSGGVAPFKGTSRIGTLGAGADSVRSRGGIASASNADGSFAPFPQMLFPNYVGGSRTSGSGDGGGGHPGIGRFAGLNPPKADASTAKSYSRQPRRRLLPWSSASM